MRYCKQQPIFTKCRLLAWCLASIFFTIGTVHAMNFSLGEDTTLDVDVLLKYEAAWRLKDPDPALVSEGNLNFKKDDMIHNRVSTLIDIDLQHKNAGLFLRPRAYYDEVYDDDKFADKTQDMHRDKVEILDAFAYGDFDLGGLPLTIRAGRQVVNWGESVYVTQGIGFAQNSLDATALNNPGVELKEVFLPTTQLFAKLNFSNTFSVASFYKFEWAKVRVDERGAYWSFNDLVDEAGADVPIADLGPLGVVDIDQRDPVDADDDGEWGVAFRYVAEALNATEFGLYYMNYHEKTPMIIFNQSGGTADVDPAVLIGIDPTGVLNYLDQTSYNIAYAEDVQLYAFTISTEIFGWNVAPEVTYRQDYPVMVVDSDPMNAFGFTYADGDVLQVQVSFLKLFRGSALWETLDLLGEVGWNKVMNDDDFTLVNDSDAWGYTVQLTPGWYNLISGLDLAMPITYSGNPDGVSSMAASFDEKADSLGIGLNFTYKQKYRLGFGYTTFLGGPEDDVHADRDNISMNFQYNF